MKRWLHYAVLGLCAWYIILIGVHFFNQRPLWNDEECVLRNITQLSPRDLFSRTLLSDQAFPRSYLCIIQQFSQHWDYSRLSLRLFPFLAMLCAFMVWLRIGFLSWTLPVDRLNFILCWTASVPLIYYAAELKQYSMDVLAASVLVYLLMKISTRHLSASWLCLFPLFGLFSYVSLFLAFVPLCVMRLKKQVLLTYLGVCVAVMGGVWLLDVRHSATGLLEIYWHDYFISFASLLEFFKTFGEGINNLISRWFVEIPKSYRAMARVFGAIGLAYVVWEGIKDFRNRTSVSVAKIALIIMLELIILGALRKFPFTVPRMSLFFAPMLMFGIVEALAWARQRSLLLYRPLQAALWLYLGFMSLGITLVVFHGDLGAQSRIW